MDDMSRFTLDYIVNLAHQAGAMIVSGFQSKMGETWKADGTKVTATDIDINQMVVDAVSRDFPTLRVIGEEGSNSVQQGDYALVFDPNDGTTSFKAGIPVSSFCATLVCHGQPLITCIYDPFWERMYTAKKGEGAHCNGKLIQVSHHASLVRAQVGLGLWKGCRFNMLGALAAILEADAKYSKPLSIAYWGALVAAGEFDATIFPSTNPWETAAIKLLVEEAGGRVTDIFGNVQEHYDGEIRGHIASNGLIHDQLSAIMREVNGL
ncbi:MAG: inositol monophosphatase family protein [Candidatus Moraniibacteriota bacterium]